jgi:DNA-binding PadR family transcriptional regulator
MTGTLQERLRLARIVLAELSRQPLRRTELEKRTIRKCGTHSKFEGIFRYLCQNGYVEKSSSEHTAPYSITEKGKKFLEGLANE